MIAHKTCMLPLFFKEATIIDFKLKHNYFRVCVGFYRHQQPQVYLRFLPLEHPSHLPPHPAPLGCYWFEFPESYSKFPLALYFAYGNVSFHVTVSIHCTPSFLRCCRVHKSLLYVYVSIAALQIGSSVPSF